MHEFAENRTPVCGLRSARQLLLLSSSNRTKWRTCHARKCVHGQHSDLDIYGAWLLSCQKPKLMRFYSKGRGAWACNTVIYVMTVCERIVSRPELWKIVVFADHKEPSAMEAALIILRCAAKCRAKLSLPCSILSRVPRCTSTHACLVVI